MFGVPTRQSPIELTRDAIRSGNGGDYEAMMVFFGPESSFDLRSVGLGRYVGQRAIRRFLEEWIGSSDEIAFHLDEVQEIGDGVILAAIQQRTRPTGSKGFLHLRYAAVYLWVDGISQRVTHFRSFDEARAAAEQLADSTVQASCDHRP